MKDSLVAMVQLMAILAGLAGTVLYIMRTRGSSIEAMRRDLARSWTNERAIHSKERLFVELDLRLGDGDLVGQVNCNASDRPLEARVEVGWGRALLHVSELLGRRVVPVGRVRLRITGNRDRLNWRLVGHKGEAVLPRRTELWPNPARSQGRSMTSRG
jgi:hypothetical protein